MAEAVCVKAFQALASYRIPQSLVIRESYPLPPYSTVIGMVHAACGFTEYVPMRVSVQGHSHGSVSNPYIHYSFNQEMPYDASRHNVVIRDGDKQFGVTRGMQHIELLCDVSLLIHIIPEDAALAARIRDGLLNPDVYPALGRHEDVVRIDSAELTEVTECELDDEFVLPMSAYIPVGTAAERDMYGTVYCIGKVFEIDGKGRRRWRERAEVRYVSKGARMEYSDTSSRIVERDGFGNPVFAV